MKTSIFFVQSLHSFNPAAGLLILVIKIRDAPVPDGLPDEKSWSYYERNTTNFFHRVNFLGRRAEILLRKKQGLPVKIKISCKNYNKV